MARLELYLLIVLICVGLASSFFAKHASTKLVSRLPLHLHMSKLEILARHFELTPPLSERIHKRVGKVLDKLGHDVLSAHVVLKILRYDPNQHHTHTIKKDANIAEVTVYFKGGQVFVAKESSDDMYASIDLLSHKVATGLKKHNEKLREKQRRLGRELKEHMHAEALKAEEGFDEDFDEDELISDLDEIYRPKKKVSSLSKHMIIITYIFIHIYIYLHINHQSYDIIQ
ncbi:ribosome-associated translation inhibitor RaiA [archaeon]|nr:MAG: ribosome-associated translation inhibitor RaiA [archaeon]